MLVFQCPLTQPGVLDLREVVSQVMITSLLSTISNFAFTFADASLTVSHLCYHTHEGYVEEATGPSLHFFSIVHVRLGLGSAHGCR